MKKSSTYSSEVRERAVRMVQEHPGQHASQWAAIGAIAAKIGCTAQTLCNWVRQAERDRGLRSGTTTPERERFMALEQENRELRHGRALQRAHRRPRSQSGAGSAAHAPRAVQ